MKQRGIQKVPVEQRKQPKTPRRFAWFRKKSLEPQNGANPRINSPTSMALAEPKKELRSKKEELDKLEKLAKVFVRLAKFIDKTKYWFAGIAGTLGLIGAAMEAVQWANTGKVDIPNVVMSSISILVAAVYPWLAKKI